MGRGTKAIPGRPSVETVLDEFGSGRCGETLGKQRQNEMQTLLENQYRKPGRFWWT